jgi:hypothetical protein
MNILQHIHRDIYSLILAILVLAGFIFGMLLILDWFAKPASTTTGVFTSMYLDSHI